MAVRVSQGGGWGCGWGRSGVGFNVVLTSFGWTRRADTAGGFPRDQGETCILHEACLGMQHVFGQAVYLGTPAHTDASFCRANRSDSGKFRARA